MSLLMKALKLISEPKRIYVRVKLPVSHNNSTITRGLVQGIISMSIGEVVIRTLS